MNTSSVRAVATIMLITLAVHLRVTKGHGRLIDPPSRSSMWRYGFSNPPNYDDEALWCGGFSAQWEVNGGRCGVCGDRFDGPHDNEAGGKYANGIIVRHYREGETISVSVDLTTSHLGYFEFRICPNNNPHKVITQQCLDRYLLQQPDGSTRYYIKSYDQGVRTVQLVLPQGLTCTQCVLQWKYNAGNSWRCDGLGVSRKCCDGCGPQEQFYGCADVDVSPASGGSGILPSGSGSVAVHLPTACRGRLFDSMTDDCRQKCAVGICSRLYCSEECHMLRAYADEGESQRKDNAMPEIFLSDLWTVRWPVHSPDLSTLSPVSARMMCLQQARCPPALPEIVWPPPRLGGSGELTAYLGPRLGLQVTHWALDCGVWGYENPVWS
ncbi:hypothetical protein BaRGS_00019507 [Batillaria attramentaria]|uniref:Chitin-binding type-4 domain-containing protein n=1 Tax=Batillaria attramentaria TaxID=370345 RepID=A0ABD0KPR9_9CAEN